MQLSCSHHTTGKGGNTDDQCQGGGNQLNEFIPEESTTVHLTAEAGLPNPFSKLHLRHFDHFYFVRPQDTDSKT